MSDREVSRSPPGHKQMSRDRDRGERDRGDRERDRDHSPRDRRDDSPRSHKLFKKETKSYSRSPSPSRSRKMSYREEGGGGRDRERRGDRRDDRERDRDRDRERDSRRDRSDRCCSDTRSSHCSLQHSLVSSRYSPSRSCALSRSSSRPRRSHDSHSPMSSRRRHTGTRDNPKPSRCIGIFGLSVYTTEEELYHIMSKYGPVERVQVVIDAKTGRSRGFSFVYFESCEDAKVAKEQCTGMKISGKNIRVDFSITERAHTPTPGIYMGKPTYVPNEKWDRGGGRGERGSGRDRDRDGGGGGGGGSYRSSKYHRDRRSPSPYYRRKRYERSRSRSYSPQRYSPRSRSR